MAVQVLNLGQSNLPGIIMAGHQARRERMLDDLARSRESSAAQRDMMTMLLTMIQAQQNAELSGRRLDIEEMLGLKGADIQEMLGLKGADIQERTLGLREKEMGIESGLRGRELDIARKNADATLKMLEDQRRQAEEFFPLQKQSMQAQVTSAQEGIRAAALQREALEKGIPSQQAQQYASNLLDRYTSDVQMGNKRLESRLTQETSAGEQAANVPFLTLNASLGKMTGEPSYKNIEGALAGLDLFSEGLEKGLGNLAASGGAISTPELLSFLQKSREGLSAAEALGIDVREKTKDFWSGSAHKAASQYVEKTSDLGAKIDILLASLKSQRTLMTESAENIGRENLGEVGRLLQEQVFGVRGKESLEAQREAVAAMALPSVRPMPADFMELPGASSGMTLEYLLETLGFNKPKPATVPDIVPWEVSWRKN